MKSIQIHITTSLVLFAIGILSLPVPADAYSYIGNPTAYPAQDTRYYDYSVNNDIYWHYNRYPYTNSYYPNPIVENRCSQNYSRPYYGYNTHATYQYQNCWQYQQYTTPTYEYLPYYESEYVTYYPQQQYYPTYEPYCWNGAYCDYSQPYYYSI